MTLADWSEYGSGGSEITDTSQYAGDSSVTRTSSGNPSPLILKESESDSPTEGMVETYFLELNVGHTVNAWFRTDTDIVNSGDGYRVDLDNTSFDLYKYTSGAPTSIDTASLSGEDFGATSWDRVRFTCWESGGNLVFRVEQDINLNNSWDQISTDLEDPSPINPGGGGIGIGQNVTASFIDNTSVYY